MGEPIKVTTAELRQRQEEWEITLEKAHQAGLEAAQALTILEDCFQARMMPGWKKKVGIWKENWTNTEAEARTHLEKLSQIAAIYEATERSNQDVFTNH